MQCARLYNDLPQVSFVTGRITSRGPDDAIADEAGMVLAGRTAPSAEAFNLRPMTLDRPQVRAVLRLDQLNVILQRLEILPQAEIGALVNLVVLAQAVLIALVVLAVPLAAPRQVRAGSSWGAVWPLVYFPALGLGFLFIELFMIEKGMEIIPPGDRACRSAARASLEKAVSLASEASSASAEMSIRS